MNDLISRQHFDERVRLAGGMADEELTQDFKDGVLTVLEMLKTEPPVNPNTWIPVTEKWPEENGRYWVTVEFEHKDGYEDYQTSIATFEDGTFWDLEDSFIGEPKRIAAWMPYNEPEPWKGG